MTTAASMLLASLRARGVTVGIEDGRLRVTPAGALSEGEVASLRDMKVEIVALIEAEPPASERVSIVRVARKLSPARAWQRWRGRLPKVELPAPVIPEPVVRECPECGGGAPMWKACRDMELVGDVQRVTVDWRCDLGHRVTVVYVPAATAA